MKRIKFGLLTKVLFFLFAINLSGWEKRPVVVQLMMRHNAEYWFTNRNEIEFCKAIEREDLNKIKRMLDKGLDINTQGKNGMTFVAYAFLKEKKKSYKFLLEQGANPNTIITSKGEVGKGGWDFSGLEDSLLTLAVEDPDPYYLEEGLNYIVNPNEIKTGTAHILHDAINANNFNNLKLLIEAGANPDGIGDGGPLENAILGDDYDMAYYLLQKGANPNLRRDEIILHIMKDRLEFISDVQLEYRKKVKRILEEKWHFDFSEKNLKRIEEESERRYKEWEKAQAKEEGRWDRIKRLLVFNEKYYATSESEKHSITNLFDKDTNTYWMTEKNGGIDQEIFILFNTSNQDLQEKWPKGIYILNGVAKSKELYLSNNRAKDIEIKLYKVLYDIDKVTNKDVLVANSVEEVRLIEKTNLVLSDNLGEENKYYFVKNLLAESVPEKRVKFGKVFSVTYAVVIKINSIYEGKKRDNLCISEIGFLD